MATFTLTAAGYPVPSGTKTLSGTTAQSVAISNASAGQLRDVGWDVEIVNLSGSSTIYFTASGTTATAANGIAILPSTSVRWSSSLLAPTGDVISIVGAGGETFQVNLWPGGEDDE